MHQHLRRHFAPAALLCLVTTLAYSSALSAGFAMDAPLLILKDPRLRAATAENVRLIFTQDYWYPFAVGNLYRPLTTLSFLFNYTLLRNEQHPAAYHAVNLAIHLFNVMLVYGLATKLFRTRRGSFFAAAIWAVHPIGTEVVANIAGRADLLSTFFVLAALLLYINSDRLQVHRVWIAIILFILTASGVLTKENVAVLPALMLAWDIGLGFKRRRLLFYLPVVFALAAYAASRHAVMAGLRTPERPFVDNPLYYSDFWTVKLTAIKVAGLQLLHLIYPLRISSDYSYNHIALAGFTDAGFWSALLAISAIMTAVVVRRRRDPAAFFLIAFFAIAYLPTSNLLITIGSIMADRFLYLPSIAFALLLTASVLRLLRVVPATVMLAAIVAALGVGTFVRSFAWYDDVSLARTDVSKVPGSFKLHTQYAGALYERNPREQIDLIVREEELAWAIVRDLPERHIPQEVPNNLGVYYRDKGDMEGGTATEEGRRWYEKSLQVLLTARAVQRISETARDGEEEARGHPLDARFGFSEIYLNLGAVYTLLGRYQEAADALWYGRAMKPLTLSFYDQLATVYMRVGNPAGAAMIWHEKLMVSPADAHALSELKQYYGKIKPAPCAITANGQFDLSCPAVADVVCPAYADMVQTARQSRSEEQSWRLKHEALARGCPRGDLDRALPEGGVF